MKYRFDLKIQLIYGIIGFFMAFIILFLGTGEFNWIASFAIGIGNFAVAGFYTNFNKTCR